MRKFRALTQYFGDLELEPLPSPADDPEPEPEPDPPDAPEPPNPPAPGWVPSVDCGRPSEAPSPEQSPPPRSAGPDVCWMNSGRAIGRPMPVIGSAVVVSAVAIITQPRSSTPLVKKSPRRRSSPVATHVVPLWQMFVLSEIGRPDALVAKTLGAGVFAPWTVAL